MKLPARRISLAFSCAVTPMVGAAQPPPSPPPPLVIGRDLAEPQLVIGKQFELRVWLSNVGGPGMHHIHVVRLAEDGTIKLPNLAAIKAEGTTIAATEAAVSAAYKPSSPTANAWITIIDRNPPAPPPPPPATTQATTQPATQAATQPATQASR